MRASILLLAIGAASASPASAAMSVIGSGYAHSCYVSAESRHASPADIALCTTALTEEGLNARDRAATYVNRGILMMRKKDFDKAIADYESAIRARPEMAEAWVNKGIALVYKTGRDEEAIAALTKGIELKTSRPEVAYYSRGLAYELTGDAKSAYYDYKQAAALRPDWEEPAKQMLRFQVIGPKKSA